MISCPVRLILKKYNGTKRAMTRTSVVQTLYEDGDGGVDEIEDETINKDNENECSFPSSHRDTGF